MNEQETKRRLNCLEAACKNLSTEISILKATLAEKPKLRHGDFGYKGGCPRIYCGEGFNYIMYGKSGDPKSVLDRNSIDLIFGNVFDLMKGWGEKPKKSFHSKSGREGIGITIDVDNKEIWLGNTGDSDWYSYEQAYEIWCELGKRLMTLKRKENKCS